MVFMSYRDSQRPLLVRWKLKENTVTPNHGHSNQRQQLTRFYNRPFQGYFLSFQMQCLQSFLYTKSRAFQTGSCASCLHIRARSFQRMRVLTFLTRVPVFPSQGNGDGNVTTCCNGKVGGVKKERWALK